MKPNTLSPLQLDFGITFSDLYSEKGIHALQHTFELYVKEIQADLYNRYKDMLISPSSSTSPSDLLIDLSPLLEDFLAQLFKIQPEIHTLQDAHHLLAPLWRIKRQFVQRYALKRYKKEDIQNFDPSEYRATFEAQEKKPFSDLLFAQRISTWLLEEAAHPSDLEAAALYCVWAVETSQGRQFHQHSPLFKLPQKCLPTHLIDWEKEGNHIQGREEHQRPREGFGLTDPGVTRVDALDAAHYCIWCHHQGKDSCSKGLAKKTTPADPLPHTSSKRFQENSFQIPLEGCPLEVKISEMNEVKAAGYSLGALAIIIIDNPMLAATGHRICNDCTKSCIYQKQEPVPIPNIETQILTDVLDLPWGFEIYSLLTRWNPLNFQRPCAMPSTGQKILVVGMGPAGFTLAHHLLNEGHTVVGVDGLKIEPLDPSLSCVDKEGNRVPFHPIKHLKEIKVPLDRRLQSGFGGVAEYGITVRWDKNYLTMIRLLLERRETFALYGGVRFGGTLTIEQALDLGFDHIALCMGAGSPTLLPFKNSGVPGVRQASDFLMALQLTGASKKDSLNSLQVSLPAVVIGGGLTAIDTATEVMAYYPLQVEKFYHRYHELCRIKGESAVHSLWSPSEHSKADLFLTHGAQILAERNRATRSGELPNFIPLLQSWGGVTLAYRREFIQSPSYRLNHEEVEKALEEGIWIQEQVIPLDIETDEFGDAAALKVRINDHIHSLPARSIFVAAGTKPNVNLGYDEEGLTLTPSGQGMQTFQAITEEGTAVQPEKSAKPLKVEILMKQIRNGKYMSFFGDMHPSFAGNVVKAMASAKQGYPLISRLLNQQSLSPTSPQGTRNFFEHLNSLLRPTVRHVNRLTSSIVEIVLHAPQAAKNFRPGQFFRLQNYETYAPTVQGTKLAMEGIALTGAEVDPIAGTISTIVLEMGGSSQLCQFLKPGEPLVFMGPTGEPTDIPHNKTVLLIGGGLGNAVLFSIGQAMRNQGCYVIYVAGYKKAEDLFKMESIEAAADQIIWCCDQAPGFIPSRPQDLAFVGNIVQAMAAYGEQTWDSFLNPQIINTSLYKPLEHAEHLLVIGSDRLMAAVAEAQRTSLKTFLSHVSAAFASINSPMQCMMKEICAQCLQRHIDPLTGEEKIVYSCVQQDQLLQQVDFGFLSQRLHQNSVQEKLNAQWTTLISSR